MHNYRTLHKSFLSYMKAVKDITDKFPILVLKGSGYSHCIGESFTCNSNKVDYATDCYCGYNPLFEYGRPQLIGKTWHLYSSDFFRINFTYSHQYKIWYYPEKKSNFNEHELKVQYYHRSWGIGKWNKDKKEIKEIALKTQSNVKEKILNELKLAEQEYQKWKNAIRDVTNLIK